MCVAFVFACLEGDDGMRYVCFNNGVCMYGIAIVEELCRDAYRDLLELVCEAIL